MSNYEERLAASQEMLEAALADKITAAGEAVSGRGRETCIECNEPIPEARRSVAAFAVRCTECQQFFEHERLLK